MKQGRKGQPSPAPQIQPQQQQQRPNSVKTLSQPRELDLSLNQELAPVYIDVGGCAYTSTLDTLTRHTDSRLAKLFNGSLPIVHDDKKNNYFIDRDGASFRHILNYLRTSKLILPDNFDEFEQLLEEARWFELDSLVKLIEDFAEQKRAAQNNKRKLENNDSLYTTKSSKLTEQQNQTQQQQLIDGQLKAFLLRTAFRNPSLTASSSCSQEDPCEETSAQSPASTTSTATAEHPQHNAQLNPAIGGDDDQN